MKKYLIVFLSPLMLLVLLFSSCATSGAARWDEVSASIDPPGDKALVYTIRPSKIGFVIPFETFAGAELIGVTKGRNFFYTYLPPGSHTFRTRSENNDELVLKLEAGRTYFLRQKVQMGLIKARVKVVEVDEAEGRPLLAKCRLSQNFALTSATE